MPNVTNVNAAAGADLVENHVATGSSSTPNSPEGTRRRVRPQATPLISRGA